MLDNIRKNRIKSSLITALTTFVAAMIIWPLLDLLWTKVISHSDFNYTLSDYVLEPAIFAVIFGIITYIFWKPTTKLEQKDKSKAKPQKS
ncbi:hypothetical protein IIZ77_00325 [Candidatus Saccharibacteria bacterium]|nr:hypothetical protein [Candidatus Saccharibacteria bacterium]